MTFPRLTIFGSMMILLAQTANQTNTVATDVSIVSLFLGAIGYLVFELREARKRREEDSKKEQAHMQLLENIATKGDEQIKTLGEIRENLAENFRRMWDLSIKRSPESD